MPSTLNESIADLEKAVADRVKKEKDNGWFSNFLFLLPNPFAWLGFTLLFSKSKEEVTAELKSSLNGIATSLLQYEISDLQDAITEKRKVIQKEAALSNPTVAQTNQLEQDRNELKRLETQLSNKQAELNQPQSGMANANNQNLTMQCGGVNGNMIVITNNDINLDIKKSSQALNPIKFTTDADGKQTAVIVIRNQKDLDTFKWKFGAHIDKLENKGEVKNWVDRLDSNIDANNGVYKNNTAITRSTSVTSFDSQVTSRTSGDNTTHNNNNVNNNDASNNRYAPSLRA